MTPLEWGPPKCHTYDTKNGCELQSRYVSQTFKCLHIYKSLHIGHNMFLLVSCSKPLIICGSFCEQLYTYIQYCLQAAVCNMSDSIGFSQHGFQCFIPLRERKACTLINKPYRLIFLGMTLKTQRELNCRENVV